MIFNVSNSFNFIKTCFIIKVVNEINIMTNIYTYLKHYIILKKYQIINHDFFILICFNIVKIIKIYNIQTILLMNLFTTSGTIMIFEGNF